MVVTSTKARLRSSSISSLILPIQRIYEQSSSVSEVRREEEFLTKESRAVVERGKRTLVSRRVKVPSTETSVWMARRIAASAASSLDLK